jgi:hypothetical protein
MIELAFVSPDVGARYQEVIEISAARGSGERLAR